jgi:hypothetical protein
MEGTLKMDRMADMFIHLALVADLLATKILSKTGGPVFLHTVVIGIFMGLVWTVCISQVLNCGTSAILTIRLVLVLWLFLDKYMPNETLPFPVYLSLCVPLAVFALV